MNLPYDINHPPEDPPDGVADKLLWKVSHLLRKAHQEGPDGFCLEASCKRMFLPSPCPARKMADAGLLGAVGIWGMALQSRVSALVDRPPNRRR